MFSQPSSQPLTDLELDELQGLLLGPEENGDIDGDEDIILGIDELHGFLTAVLCTPSMLMPSEYMPRIFGDREWQSMEEAQRAMGLLMQFYNSINDELRAGNFDPLLMEHKPESGENVIVSGDWCHGFVRGMSLRPHEWMIDDERFQKFMIPIVAMSDTDPESEGSKWASEHHDQLVEILPDTVMAIYGYMMNRRDRPQPAKSTPKIGRNKPCPCGSGQKYKKCCGSGDNSSGLH